jgi:TPR repeat protein
MSDQNRGNLPIQTPQSLNTAASSVAKQGAKRKSPNTAGMDTRFILMGIFGALAVVLPIIHEKWPNSFLSSIWPQPPKANPTDEEYLGELFARGGAVFPGEDSQLPQNYSKAMQCFREAADAGNPMAQYEIGWLYDNGLGVTKDHKEAMTWYLKAANAGIGPAMAKIGVPYTLGQGVTQDYEQAFVWFQKGANAGDADSMLGLGILYQSGCGVAKDREQAITWYRKSAALGNENAKKTLMELGNP